MWKDFISKSHQWFSGWICRETAAWDLCYLVHRLMCCFNPNLIVRINVSTLCFFSFNFRFYVVTLLCLRSGSSQEKITIWLKKNLVLSRCQAAELRWVRQREETVKEEGKRKRKGNEMKKEQLGESPNLCEKCPSHFLNASMVKNTQSTWTWLQVVPEPSVTYKCWNVVSNCRHWLELWISQWLIGQFYGFQCWCAKRNDTLTHSLTHFECRGRMLFFGRQCHKIFHQNKGW